MSEQPRFQGTTIAQLHSEFWNQMFDAEVGRTYYQRLAAKKGKLDRGILIFLAVVSSSAFGSFFIGPFSGLLPFVLALNALVAIVHPFLTLNDEAKDAMQKYGRYTELYYAWFGGFRKLYDAGVSRQSLIDLREQNFEILKQIDAAESGSVDNKLVAEVEEEVRVQFERLKTRYASPNPAPEVRPG